MRVALLDAVAAQTHVFLRLARVGAPRSVDAQEPLLLKARLAPLQLQTQLHVTATLVLALARKVPAPFATVQVAPRGCSSTATS